MQNCWHWCPERVVNGAHGMECIDLTKNSVSLLKKWRMFSKFGEQET